MKVSEVVEFGVFVMSGVMAATGIALLVDKAMDSSEKRKFENDVEYVSSLINKKNTETE